MPATPSDSDPQAALDVESVTGGTVWRARFHCMASPCEVLLQTEDAALARRLAEAAQAEARRIEAKFSRYRDDSVIAAVHAHRGRPFLVDEETGHLLDLTARCHALSDGAFDITSGILRRAWTFDGSDRVPSQKHVDALLPHIGWQRVQWTSPRIVLPEGMEIDFGGIGKEYAVDRVADILGKELALPFLVNFGGDLRANRARRDGSPWSVGIEDPAQENRAERLIELRSGGLATSGDARRYLLRKGVRYSHILDPRTGWPVTRAPRSVTVVAGSCVEAGLLATLAMLQGSDAESFLEEQGVRWWCRR
jgi:thiamine biosynthesis lipoprotein